MSGFGVLAGNAKDGAAWGGRSPSIKSGYAWKTNLAVSLSVRSPDSTISPQEHDLMTDKYAPRAFADYTANMSSTFQQVAPKGSYIGSPPRSRDKYIITREKMTFKPYALEYGRW